MGLRKRMCLVPVGSGPKRVPTSRKWHVAYMAHAEGVDFFGVGNPKEPVRG